MPQPGVHSPVWAESLRAPLNTRARAHTFSDTWTPMHAHTRTRTPSRAPQSPCDGAPAGSRRAGRAETASSVPPLWLSLYFQISLLAACPLPHLKEHLTSFKKASSRDTCAGSWGCGVKPHWVGGQGVWERHACRSQPLVTKCHRFLMGTRVGLGTGAKTTRWLVTTWAVPPRGRNAGFPDGRTWAHQLLAIPLPGCETLSELLI